MAPPIEMMEAWSGWRGLLTALCLSPVMPLAHAWLVRRFDGKWPSLASLAAAAALWGMALALALFQIASARPADWVSAGATLGTLVLVYAECFSMLCRGFSLRLVMDIHRRPGLTLPQLMDAYADGKGASWLMEKRLQGLLRSGLVQERDGFLVCERPVGRWIAMLADAMKASLNIGKGG